MLPNPFAFVNRHRSSPLLHIALIGSVALLLFALGMLTPNTKLGFILVIILAIISPRMRGFAFDFMPFIILILVYNELRRFADDISPSDLNITNLIEWERSLFGGTLPGHWLQSHLMDRTLTPLLDVLTNATYLSHFITPVIMAGILWWFRRSEYWAFILALVVLSFAAFATYVLFPAAPPWWATANGYLDDTPISLAPFIVDEEAVASGPNPVAAMPSLHIAYPTFFTLAAITIWGKRGLPVILLPLGVMFSAAYLGHHYVIDGIAGATYALVIYLTVYWWLRKTQLDLRIWAGERIRRRSPKPAGPPPLTSVPDQSSHPQP